MPFEKCYRRMEKKKIWIWIFLMIASFCLLGKGIFEGYALHKAKFYVSCANCANARIEQMENYKKALYWSPGYEEIYEGIMEKWLIPDSFCQEDFMELLTALEDSDALKRLKFRNPKVYVSFSYYMALVCFYDFDQADGRKEAMLWFSKTLGEKKYLTKAERKLAQAWLTIGKMQPHEDALTYFHALHELNEPSITDVIPQFDSEKRYQISYGILSEIRRYCRIFLRETELQAKDLYLEVNRAEEIIRDSRYEMKQKQKEQLALLVADTRKRIQIMEEAHENEE